MRADVNTIIIGTAVAHGLPSTTTSLTTTEIFPRGE
jgi:hypothetical protein